MSEKDIKLECAAQTDAAEMQPSVSVGFGKDTTLDAPSAPPVSEARAAAPITPANVKNTRVRPTSIGGQAVMEGVMMMGPSSVALAVRAENGDILLDTHRTNPKYKRLRKIPVLRGIINFVISMITGMKTIMKSAEVVGADDEEELGKGSLTLALLVGVLLAVGLFIGLPLLIKQLVFDRFIESNLLRSLAEGGVRLGIFIAYLALTSFMKDIRRTFMYHGAEHKTINCFEKGLDLTVANVRASSKVHSRCGTTFLFFVVMISILVFMLTGWLAADVLHWGNDWYILLAIRLVMLPFVAGVSYEVLKLLAMLPDNVFTYILKAPGLAMQALTTRQPDDKMIEVAIAAFSAVIELEKDKLLPVKTFDKDFKTCRADMTAKVTAAGIEAAEVDWIACKILSRRRGELALVDTVTQPQERRIRSITDKRIETGLPLAYLLKETEFYGMRIMLDQNVLIPRPETELLAEQVITNAKKLYNPKILDLCTGSGCIALAVVKSVPKCKVDVSDVSAAALNVARQNLRHIPNARHIFLTDLFNGINGKYDVIVANPPYISTGDLRYLQSEVKKEPVRALDGGADGLDVIRRIIAEAPRMLFDGGTLLLEIGFDQSDAVKELLQKDFCDIKAVKDYDGADRIFVAVKKAVAELTLK
ncbi:MAG: peptide chain release factor N(5)-glutamine methyltransferase, partial [Clostridiales bacterium]|nr:peptide chain release factor N(5)-glutamine methyltransferase [Clostridiales bacterium]